MYSYLCDNCEVENHCLTFKPIGEKIQDKCDECGYPTLTRAICRISTHLSMPEHYNHSTGQYVTNKRAFTSQLDAKSDEMSARMGVDIKYKPVDPADQKALGVTNDNAQEIVTKESDPKRKKALDKVLG